MVTLDNMTDGNASFLRAARSGNLEKVIEHLKGNIDINTSNANGLNALHLAAKEGHVAVVTELLKRGANVNAATKKGNTALHIASLAGQEEVVRVLIQLGANVNVQSQNGFTPLYMAAQENHDHVVSFLLSNGANQSLATEDGFTPLAVALQQGHDRVVAVLLENDTKGRVRLPALHIAAKKDDCKAATLLLQSDHNPDVTSKSGFTPLHIAAHYGNENIAKILLSKGADVNYAAKHQITPLHVASKWGKTNMVVLLLEKGANIEAATRDGLTPLHCAARSGHEQVVDLLLEKGAPFLAKTKNGLAPLHMASQGDHVDSARILLYHKAPVDDVTVDYLTALHVAAHCGHVKVAKLLLDRKADPNARALNGFTPMHIACKKNRIKVVELLLKHGASIEATTESGLTPLHVASFMGCMNIVIYLIQNGAHPDVPTVRGETPLHLAARANQTDIIRILLRNGASVDARAREEQTPLHIAARLGNVDIVSLLLQHGAAVDAVTKDMYTALHIAAKEDQEEVASALLDHGASLTSTTKKGFTPLHLAAKYGNIKVARLLLQKGAPVDAQGKNGVTPLHVAAHYDHVNVALLLLDKGASPHAMAKNGYTPLHIAAKKNQMDIASTLLEYGAKTNSESKAGFTPLHLSSQEGHGDMTSLLIEHKADVNHQANNGLTPLHLCAQDDRVGVASILTKNGAEICPKTKAGYTPLHVAAHFGQINMVRFLLQNDASVHNTTSHGYTPLHQAAQQGHTLVVNLLLENQASPNVTTMQGQTPLSIAQRLGYISVVETLKVVTETTVITTTTTVTEEKYKVVAPETMQETFMTDSEDEGGADFDEAAFFGKPTHATHVYLPYVEGKHFQMSEEAMLGDQSYRYLTADEMKSLGDDSLPIDVTKDEKHHDVMQSVKQFGAPMVEEDNLSPQHVTPIETGFSEKYSPDNVDLARAPVHAGSFSWDDDFYYSFPPKGMLRSSRLKWKTFLVSFMVDARGGAMRGCRHSGVRVIIPPRKAAMPMRITCRYLRKEKLIHPPPLMEGEACASRILEMGPVSAKFLGPVIIEVPHFASTRGKEREIIILRSDTGESWREHTLEASEEAVQEVLNESFEGEELSALEDLNTNRITRILTTDFPQYFAIVCRVRQESHGVGPEGGMVSSTVVPQVQAIFPEGALTKKIRVGLQAQPIAPELVAKLLGNRVAVSPIVTVEPRRRKFHKPITLTIPVPQAVTKGMINQYSGEAPTLRLLCSITGGSSKAQWEDVTGSTPLTFVNDCVSFTTTVSARFWLMDCRQVNEVTRFATELYQEAVYVPFMSKFVIFAKRNDPYEAQLRVFCMTDDKEDKTLESQEHFTEVAKSRDVEVLEGKTEYLEFAGNLVPVTKSGEQLKFTFQAFHENRLPFTIRVKDPHAEPMGRIAFMREPRAGRGEPPQVPICNLNVALPELTMSESSPDVLELVTLEKRYDFIQEAGLSKPELIHRADLRLSDIARELDKDWICLAQQLDLSEGDIEQLKSESAGEPPEQALMMLRVWLQKSGSKATGNELEKALRRINREDIIKNCMFNVELVTDDVEKAVAKVHLDQSGFDVFKEELGSSREASMRRGASLDISYDEQDIMKEAESAAETSSETGSLFERDHLSHSLADDRVEKPEIDESAYTHAGMLSKNVTVTTDANSNTVSDPSSVEVNAPILTCELLEQSAPDIVIDHQRKANIILTDTIPSQNESMPENLIENEMYQSNRKLHEFWPPDKISLKSFQTMSKDSTFEDSNAINTKQEIIFEENSYNIPTSYEKCGIEEIHIASSNGTNQENVEDEKAYLLTETKQKNDLNKSNAFDVSNANEVYDLGYCSMDKDPSFCSMSKTVMNNTAEVIDINRSDHKLIESEKYPAVIMPHETEDDMVQILNNRNIVMQSAESIDSKLLESNLNFKNYSLCESSKTNQPQLADEETKMSKNLKSEDECPIFATNISTSVCETEIKRDDNSFAEDSKIRRASKTPPPSPVDEEDAQERRNDTLKDISPSALVFHIKEENFKKYPDTEIKTIEEVGEAIYPAVGQELVARLTESETWPSGDLDTSQVSVSSLPDDEKSETNTAVFETTVTTTRETITTLGDSDKFHPAATTKDVLQKHAEPEDFEKTKVDDSGSTTHIIQRTTHMTIIGKTPELASAGEDQDLMREIVLERHSEPIVESSKQKIPEDQQVMESKFTTDELSAIKLKETVDDSPAPETVMVESTVLDSSRDIVEETPKAKVVAQSEEISSGAQIPLSTEGKVMEKHISIESQCESSAPYQTDVISAEEISKVEISSQEHAHKTSVSKDEAIMVQVERSNLETGDVTGDSTAIKQLIPCAFDNTAFAGADFIDEVEQTVPVRARSPYEVVRDDQNEMTTVGVGQTSNEKVKKEVFGGATKVGFMPKQGDIRRRPILQHIPSEISEEDLVEREIISPITKQEFDVFEDVDTKSKEIYVSTEISYSVTETSEEKGSPLDKSTKGVCSKTFTDESDAAGEDIMHTDSKEVITAHSVQQTCRHTEKDDANKEVCDQAEVRQTESIIRSPPTNLPVKNDLTENVIKTDEGTTPESDTGIPSSPFELVSGSEISDEDPKTGVLSSVTLITSDHEDRSQDSVITTTHSQSYTESTFSASIRSSSKDLSDSCTLNEAMQLQLKSKSSKEDVMAFTKTLKEASDDYVRKSDKQILNGPGEVDYRPEYDDDHEYVSEERFSEHHGFSTMRISEGSTNDAFDSDDYKKSRYSSVSDDVIDSEIGEICSSDQQLEDIIERPVTPEPPIDDEEYLMTEKHMKREFQSSCSESLNLLKRDELSPGVEDDQLVLSPLESPDELKPGFAYGMQFEKEVLDSTEEAMDIDSDQYSEEKEPSYAYGMRFERDPDLEEEEIPCYGDLYTHEEEDEDALDSGEKAKSFQKQVKDADFDILAGRKYFSKNVEFDDLSMSSLQEFERLEAEIVSGRKSSIGSLDSLNGKNQASKSGEHDDVSMSSLTEFERIERECTETEKVDPSMQESITQLSEIEEGHESQASEASHGNRSDDAKEDLSILEDQDIKLQDIDELALDTPGIVPEELPYQFIMQKTHATTKSVSREVKKADSDGGHVRALDTAEIQIETLRTSTIKHEADTRQKSLETYSYDSVKEDDMDQDSLRDEFSLKPDSLIEDGNKDFQDSLHEDKLDDADSLQGDLPDEMRDSLFEEKHIEDDSLHEMDILPDESSLSLESSIAAALSHDSSKADDRKRYSFDGESDALRLNLRDIVTSTEKAEIVVTDFARGDVMVSSTDSLEQSSSAALAAFHMESESAMSSSLNSAITSEDYTMISSTDTLEHEGRITFRYEDIPVDDLETLIRDGKKVFVDSEGNIQAQYNVKHILETEGNINSLCSREKTEIQLPSPTTVHVHSAVTSVKYVDDRTKKSAPIPFPSTTGMKTEDISYESSDFDPDVEIEEIHTTDEFGNPKIIKKVKRFVHTKTRFSSSSSPKDVEEKLKEFLREHAAGESAGVGEEEVKEEKTTDAKGNVVLIRTVQQQMLSEPQVHSKTFTGPDADTLSQEFVETFKTLDPTENVCEYEKVDEQGNVVRVTQQVVIKPEVHSISFSGPNARKQMEDYMKQWEATSQSANEYEAGQASTFYSAAGLHRFSDESRQQGVSENGIHSYVKDPSETKSFASSAAAQSSEKLTTQEAVHKSPSETEKTQETSDEKPQK